MSTTTKKIFIGVGLQRLDYGGRPLDLNCMVNGNESCLDDKLVDVCVKYPLDAEGDGVAVDDLVRQLSEVVFALQGEYEFNGKSLVCR